MTATHDAIETACGVMHDAYEAAAVGAGWETQQASRKPWADVPEANKQTMRAAVSALMEHLEPSDTGLISDGYHTFAEFYEFRVLLHAHAVQAWLAAGYPVVKSQFHSDGERCFGGGWFIVTAQLPTGQVSDHYEMSDWDLFAVPVAGGAPEWDGHTTADVAARLRAALEVTE